MATLRTLSLFRAFSLIVLLAQLRFGLVWGFDLDGLIPIPEQDQSTVDVAKLKTGGQIEGTLKKDESRVVWFGGEKKHGRFPDFLVTLQVVNRHGDADVHCAPAPWLTSLGRDPSPTFYAWRSIHSQDTDELFLSSKSNPYQGGEMSVKGSKKHIVGFACTVTGVAWEPTEYKFNLDISYDDRKLVDEEVGAIKEIYEECCSEQGACSPWKTNATETNDDNFVASDGHNIEVDFCHREGSLCSEDGHLMRLDMRNFGLSCSLPVEQFTKMKMLVKLDLDGNLMTGDVGEMVGKLGSNGMMMRLSMRGNKLSGRLDGVESYCHVFTNGGISYLDLSSNAIEGELVSCLFADADRGTASSMVELRLKANKITGGIPDVFTDESRLETLTLAENDLTGRVPDSLGTVNHMRVLDLQHNSMAGPIPDNVGNIPALYMLAGTGNFFESLPSSWSSPSWTPPADLKLVEMAQNELEGDFPIGLGNAPVLLGLDLGQNRLSGPVAVEKGQFSSLLLLNISFNTFEGQIPEALGEIGVFKDMRNSAIPQIQPSFDLRFNQFDGEVPEFFYPSKTPAITATRVFLAGNKGLTCENPDELRYTGVNCKPYDESNYIDDYTEPEDNWEETAPEYVPVENEQPAYSPPTESRYPSSGLSGHQTWTPRPMLSPVTPQQPVFTNTNLIGDTSDRDESKQSGGSKGAASVWGGLMIALLVVVALVVSVVVFKRVRRNRVSFAGETTYVPPEEEGFGYALMERAPRGAEETVPLNTQPTSQ